MGLTIDNEIGLISKEDEARLRRIANRIIKANNEIVSMGYDSYITGTGMWHVMNGETHGDSAEPCRDNAVASFPLDMVNIGEW